MLHSVNVNQSFLPQRLALILGGLRHVVAAWAGRDRNVVALVWIIYSRLNRAVQRFEAVVARLAAGVALRRRVGRTRNVASAAPSPRLPTRWAWLVRLCPLTVPFGTQLEAWLAEPEMVALLARAPEAGRIFRPWLHALGIKPSAALALPKRVRKPRAVVAGAEAPPLPARRVRRRERRQQAPSAVAVVCAAIAAEGCRVVAHRWLCVPCACGPPGLVAT